MTEQEALMLAQAGIDGSGTLLIDADTRSIYVPESEKFFGVESDQNVERKKFKCPKIVGDNIDLSTLHLYINYQNGNGNKDSYMIQDMAVSGEYITFSWVLSRNVAEYKGTVRFVFCAKKADSSGNLVNEWNTTVAEGEVIEGLEATVTVADNNPDIIEQMLTLLKNVSDEPVFTEARTRENVTNGDKVPVLWGKVKKWFADLGTAAFCKVVNNLTTVAEGGVLDARQGKELNDALAKLNKLMGNTDISSIGDGTVTDALRTLNSKPIVKHGLINNIECPANTITTVPLVYDTPFPRYPIIIPCFRSSTTMIEYGAMQIFVDADGYEKSGCNLKIANNSKYNLKPSINWIAASYQ